MVDIRLCDFDEINKLQEFINYNWRKEHILAVDKDLLCWQHYDIFSNKLNFVIGYDTEKKEILGVLGFIPLDHFDPGLSKYKDIWLAIWKVKKESKGLGMELFDFLINSYRPNSVGAIGISTSVKKLYNLLNFKTGKLIHYYYLNPYKKDFILAKIDSFKQKSIWKNSDCKLTKINDFSEIEVIKHQHNPHKSFEFLRKRYLNHPVYRYQLYGLILDHKIKCIFVTRKIEMNNSACIRIVDIYGEICNIGTLESEFTGLLVAEKAEYIDCLNFGISKDTFLNMGFSELDKIIIPNYFEPFEQINVNIEFAFYSNNSDYVIYKGDSDQDRPNIVNK